MGKKKFVASFSPKALNQFYLGLKFWVEILSRRLDRRGDERRRDRSTVEEALLRITLF